MKYEGEKNYKHGTKERLGILLTNLGKAIDARLQTAVSFFSEYSTISAQRLDDFITPIFF